MRVGAVDVPERGQVLGEDVAGLAGRVELDEVEHVAGARTEADDAGGVAAAVAYVLDVLVLGLPVEGGVLGAGHQLHGDLLLRRVVEADRRGGRGSGRGLRRAQQRCRRERHTDEREECPTRGARWLGGRSVVERVDHGDSKGWWGWGVGRTAELIGKLTIRGSVRTAPTGSQVRSYERESRGCVRAMLDGLPALVAPATSEALHRSCHRRSGNRHARCAPTSTPPAATSRWPSTPRFGREFRPRAPCECEASGWSGASEGTGPAPSPVLPYLADPARSLDASRPVA